MREILGRYERGVVLDYCMCTGICGQVALELGHKFIGVEITETLFNDAVRRFSKKPLAEEEDEAVRDLADAMANAAV